MRPFPLDEDTAERLLDGGLSPEDAPLGWERVALLVGAASGPAEESERAGDLTIIAAMADVILGDAAGEAPVGDAEIVSLDSRRTGMARFRTARVAGIAAVVVLLSGTAAAAATDALPRPAQTAVSNVAAHVGVTLPKPLPATDHDADDVAVPGAPSSTARPADHDPKIGAASKSAASTALCRSATAADLTAGTTPDTDDLGVAAAADHESVADFCRGLTPAVPAKASSTTVQGRHQGGAGEGDGGSSPSAQSSARDQGKAPNQDVKGEGGAQGKGSGKGGQSDAGNNQSANTPGGHNGQGGGNGQGDSGQGGGNGQGPGNGGQGHNG
jgi:hypothetical protein